MEPDPPAYTFVPEFTLGDRLRRSRAGTGMTQLEMADAIGMSPRSVSNYELDETVPPLAVMRDWARVTRTSYAWLAWGDPDLPVPTRENWGKLRKRATRQSTIWYGQWSHVGAVPDNALIASA